MNPMRRFLACLLLAAMALTGQFAPCDCASRAPETACTDHDHRHPADSGEHERECACPTCHQHACSHVAFTVEAAAADVTGEHPNALVAFPYQVGALTGPIAEIFTPPKLG